MSNERKDSDDQNASSVVISALENDRLALALQPIVFAQTGALASYEALLRLRRSDGTVISAGDLIVSAEKVGLAPLLDRRSLELASRILIKHPKLRMSLNASSLTAHDDNWMAALRKLIRANPGLAERLTVEITETAMIHDFARVAAFVDAIRDLGCKAAIDDFGAGYTSFRHLKTLKIDILKIDGAFVTDLPNDHQSRVIAKTMLDMARALGLETVAEWVGNEEAATFLKEAGATYLQGYLYGEPTLVEHLEQAGRI